MADDKRCTAIEGTRNLMPGWGCCVCRTYNGEQRAECKVCRHKRCDVNQENKPS